MPVTEYKDFPIQVSRITPGDKTRLFVVHIPGSVPSGDISIDEKEVSHYQRKKFKAVRDKHSIDLLDELANGSLKGADIYRVGKMLTDLLLPGTVRQHLRDSLIIVRQKSVGLRIRLKIEDPELARLPWEYMYIKPPGMLDDSPDFFLALMHDVSIVRHDVIGAAAPPDQQRHTFNLLGVFALPPKLKPLNLTADRDAIQAAIDDLGAAAPVSPVWVEHCTARQTHRSACKTRRYAAIFGAW